MSQSSAIGSGLTLLPNLASQISSSMMPAPAPFSNNGSGTGTAENGFLFFVILILLIFLTMWIGAFIFNTSVIKIFPSTKKVTVVEFFGLYIVTHLLFC